jgi:uncharacterized membrane protein
MSDLVVIGYDDMHKADEVRLTLLKMQREYLIDLEDAVVAYKKPDGKVKLSQPVDLTAMGAARGSLWGLLIGAIFSALSWVLLSGPVPEPLPAL